MNQCVNLLLIYKVKPLVLFLLRILVFRLLPLFLRKIASVRPSLTNCLCAVTQCRNIYMGRSVSKIFFWVEVWKNNTNKYKKQQNVTQIKKIPNFLISPIQNFSSRQKYLRSFGLQTNNYAMDGLILTALIISSSI